MGLDQYLHVRHPAHPEDQGREIAYWRKHNRLQGFMENLWTLKTGKSADELNCEDLELTEGDLNLLEEAIKNRALPATQGFFFGSDSYERETDEYDLSVIEEAREALSEGDKIIYNCWW